MPAIAAKNTVVKLDNAAGTLTDISAKLISVDFPQEVDTEATTPFGTSDKEHIVTLRGRTLSGSGNWDTTIDAHLEGILGQTATVTFEYGPAGETTGQPYYTGEALLTKYDISGAASGKGEFTFEVQITGAVTRSTYS